MTGKYFLTVFIISICSLLVSASSGDREEVMAGKFLARAQYLYDRSIYDSLPFYYKESDRIFERLRVFDKSAQCKLGMVDYYRMMNRMSEAESQLEVAESYISVHIGRKSDSWADAQYVRGKLYQGLGLKDEAIKTLAACSEMERELGMRPEKTARIHNALGAVYYMYGDLELAELNFQEAYDTYLEMSSGPTLEKGILLFHLGLIYSQTGRQEKWAEYTSRSIENSILLFGPEYPELAGLYNSLASYFITSGRLDSANIYLDRSESILIRAYGNEFHDLSRIYINRARIYRYEGNYQASLEHYLQALSINERQEFPDQRLENTLNINIAQLYDALGQYQTAYIYLVSLLEQEDEVHPTLMANYYSYLADILIKLGEFQEAESHLQKVFELKAAYLKHYDRLAYDYHRYGILLDSTSRFSEAGEYYLKALAIIRQNYGEYNIQTSKMYSSLGNHFLGVNKLELALQQYQHSIHSLVPEYDMRYTDQNPEPEIIPDLMFYLRLLKSKALTMENLADSSGSYPVTLEYYKAAFMTYSTSVQVTEILRNSYLNDESKLYLSENERGTYEKAVETAYRCYELSADPGYLVQAFRAAERSKYATLQSVLAREDALELSGIPDSLLEKESVLQKQLLVYQELLNERMEDTLPDQVKLQQYRSDLFRVKGQVAGLHRFFESEYPDYYKLIYQKEVDDPEELARSLGRKEKIIDYFLTARDLYIFDISRRDFSCRRAAVDSVFNYDLDLVAGYISGDEMADSIRNDHFSFIRSASRLYEKLIPPARGFNKLVIIPEGRLSYFPFDVLITEAVPEFSGLFRDVPFLIRSCSMRYGYAANMLDPGTNSKPGKRNPFIGFAPGYLTTAVEGMNLDAPREIKIDRQRLEALPGSIDEVNEIGTLLKGTSFTGMNATEERFRELSGNSDIIHLATHAFLDDEDPLKSVLVFSDNQGTGEDGLLHVQELYNMDIAARMVVLSACNTGAGELKGGEGIMSLARAFFYTGVRNIVMTLWTVSDRQSYQLMVSFYEYLRKGRRAEVSLRQAKLDFLDTALPGYQHPRYWAGYILVGNPEYLFLPGIYRQVIAAAGFIFTLLLGLVIVRRYRGRRGT